MLKNLKELVAINSYSSSDKIIEYLKVKFISFAEEIKIIKNKENENKSIIIGINTKLKDVEPIILSGHMDTVSPDLEKYKTNPLELAIIGDKAYGLGSVDMKSFVAIILDNIETIKSFNAPIILSLTTDEETDFICVKNVVEALKELNIKPKFTIVGEPTKTEINNCANGCYEYCVEVFGKSCHSSLIDQGINAINIAAKIITYIEDVQKKFKLTSNCGVVQGGDIVNRVPDFCCLKFDVRSTMISEVENFIKMIENKINLLENEYNCEIKIKKTLEILPLEIKNEETIKELAENLSVNINKFMGGCEAGYYQFLSGDAVIFGVGDMSLAHKPNEFVNVDEYKKYSEIFIKFIDKIQQKYYE